MKRNTHRYLCASALVLLCASACVTAAETHRCIHDQLAKRRGGEPLPVSLVQEVPASKGDGWQALSAAASEWAPIRIGVFTLDMEDPSKYCTQKNEMRPDFSGGQTKCSIRDIFTAEKRTMIVNRILPAAVQLHRDRLLVQPISNRIVVPTFRKGDICAEFSIPKSHFTVGAADADMLLYAAAGPTGGSTLAWALSCAQNAQTGRPVAGVMNFGPHSVEDTSSTIRVSAHEMAHALGFNLPAFAEKGLVSGAHNVRGKPAVVLLASAKVAEKTREHFGCPTVAGMELEDDGGEGTQLSHFERRNAKDELMAGISGLGVYSALTMAAFEDLGYYRANWGMEEALMWGHQKGCDFLTKPCVSNGVTNFPDHFCTEAKTEMTCTSDRRALGSCDFLKFEKTLPSQYQYFEDPKIAGSERQDLMDMCPHITAYSDTKCATGYMGAMPGSLVGANARCLKGEDLIMGQRLVGDICAEISCEKDRTVRVRYLGDVTWHACAEGESIVPSVTFSGGRILCPRYEEVCVA